MPKIKEGHVGMLLEVPADVMEALRKLAETNDRPMQAEAVHALRRHLAQPPRVVVVVPELAEETVKRGAEPTKRPGRKPTVRAAAVPKAPGGKVPGEKVKG